jgi:thiaminase/transcriptional activator TenA
MSMQERDPELRTLWASIDDVWQAIEQHPFLAALHDGTLEQKKFRYFLGQDFRYLEDFARALLHLAAKAPDPGALRTIWRHVGTVFEVEAALHQDLTAALGGDAESLRHAPRGDATEGYVDFLLHQAAHGDFASGVIAVLPCYWIYREVGLELAQQGPSPSPAYQAWIATYAGDEYGQAVDELKAIAGAALRRAPDRSAEFAAIFRQGVRHELAFWQQAEDR